MADTTNPIIPAAQDLQINLEVNEQDKDISQNENIPTSENKEPELNLDLDLNLPDAPKNDDRLKVEDQKNNETSESSNKVQSNEDSKTPEIEAITAEIPETNQTVPEEIKEPIITEPIIEQVVEDTPPQETENTPRENSPVSEETQDKKEETVNIPVIEEIPVPVVPVINEPTVAQEGKQIQASIMTEEVVVPTTATTQLNDDMKMIEDMEGHASAGGLAPEAIINTQPLPVEAPKTFDLDAMLGSPTIITTPTEVHPDRGENERGGATQTIPQTVPEIAQTTPTPPAGQIPAPGFIIPPIIPSQIPIGQGAIQTPPYRPIPQKKNITIKIVLFLFMFIALGATAFFILKTMYPLEFASILGGGQIQTQTGEEMIDTEITGEEIIATGEDLSGIDMTDTIEIDTGAHESATGTDVFGELDSLGVQPEVEQPVQNDISRLTDYVTQGNILLTQGKEIGNSKLTMYGLYMTKKGTTFLEEIANGEKIDILSGYFAQSEKYILQAKEILQQTTNVDSTASSTLPINDIQGMTTDTSTTQDTGITSE